VSDARALLDERLAELDAEIAELTAVPRDPMGSVSFGKRIGEGTNEAIDRLNKIGVVDALEAKRAEVERAIAKLEDGSYGECDTCGEAIAPERMEAMPWATQCVRCLSR
jgi:DnaK suppressor protein